MKNNLLKYYITALYFCSTYIMFAQPGDGNGGSGNGALDGDGDTTPAAPIADYIWVMAVIGLLFVFLKFKSIYKQANMQ